MKHILPLLLTFAFSLFSPVCPGQSSPALSSPDLVLKDGYLLIGYRILNGQPGDLYNIRVEITDSTGNQIEATDLSGDLGSAIPGGGDKSIRWNYSREKVKVNQGIYVEVFGELIYRGSSSGPGRRDSRMITVLRSVAFPGWGLTKSSGNKLHLIKGAVAYSSVAGSLLFNSAAYNNYNEYLDSTDPAERPSIYHTYEVQNVTSRILGFTAAAVWITDVVWTFMGSGESPGRDRGFRSAGISLGTEIEAYRGIPLLSLRYTF